MYFNCHTHTEYSNIRLLDCINHPKDVIDTAIKLGLTGCAITDHECLSAHMEINQYAKKIKEKYPDFTIALGNEIYLINDRNSPKKYWHFILIAKNALGHKALRELSSTAWYNGYYAKNMERVPTLKTELADIVNKYKGSLIATNACLGGELASLICEKNKAILDDSPNVLNCQNKIDDYLTFMLDLFGEDFYLECAPAVSKEQILVNKELYKLSKEKNIKLVIGTDAHYLRPEDRQVHKAYLNSKEGEREVDAFYSYTYLMSAEEVIQNLTPSFKEKTATICSELFENSNELRQKIEFYSLERKQIIPKIKVKDYLRTEWRSEQDEEFPILNSLFLSDNPQERYWVNECFNALCKKGLRNQKYLNRLEIEADIIKTIGDGLNDCLFAYFNTFKHYIDLFWECGSIVGPGRGSATGFLSNFLLGITQLDPIKWELPYWRFLNKDRQELPDIDIDLAPSKRPAIFKAIREERGEFGLIQVATFGTEGTKSAILAAARGYRSTEYPNGIDVDEAQYLSSLIPQERGFLWSIEDVVYGNEEKGRKPIKDFVEEVNKYPGLLEIIISISGLVNKRSSHASGVILYGEDPYETASFMRTPSGDLITCYDLHKAEAAGDTKYDFLVTDISDKLIICLDLLKKDKLIDSDMPLRECYNKYLHPEIIDTKNPLIWQHLAAGDILDVFQFSTGVGLAIAKKLKPQNPLQMTAINAMMRLMSEKGVESQQDRYIRIKRQGLEAFEREMIANNIPDDMRKILHDSCDEYYGCCAIQEQMMMLLMDCAGFSLAEANSARKIVAKKQMDKIPQFHDEVFSRFKDKQVAKYFWAIAVAPQLGYAFSKNHSLPYSFVGIQTIELAIKFPPIYWNTACLIVNSGAADEQANNSTDYGKIAKACNLIISRGIKLSLIDINNSEFGFKPDAKNNAIWYGLKGLINVGDDLIDKIIQNRPYISIKDFYYKVKPNKQAMISLIKGGAFDTLMDRKLCMAWYLWKTCDKKSKLNLQNMPSLIKYNIIDKSTPERKVAFSVYEFNRYLKTKCFVKGSTEYTLDSRAIEFLTKIEHDDLIYSNKTAYKLNVKAWDKIYQKYMDVFREWISSDMNNILYKLNSIIFKKVWDKYALGDYSKWEMQSLCFYYHKHELANINFGKYGIMKYDSLPEEPVVDRVFTKGKNKINMYKLSKICGTCIAKDKDKSTVTLLTPNGVTNVKFRKEYFSLFDKQISEPMPDGTKKIRERSWFNRGSMIIVVGMRSGDDFIAKKYKNYSGHTLYKIDSIDSNGDITIRHERYKGYEEEDNGE